MKAGRSTVKASAKCSPKTGSVGVKSSSKKTNKRDYKAIGRGVELLADKVNQNFSFKEPVGMCAELQKENFQTENREALELDLHPGQTLASCAKIKLQLFPINDGTRIGLEKGGHNPYLELTLSGRKKISSVLKHIEKKWGSSSIAKGVPMLFPYNKMEKLSDRTWTINDSDTTASDVYAAIGSPAIFRLRYGWCTQEPRSFGIPSSSIPHEPGVEYGGTKRDCNSNLVISRDEHDKVEVTSEEREAIDIGNGASEIVAQKMDNASAVSLDNEQRVCSSHQQPLPPWMDSLSNISIGGLLSEASLMGGFDPKSFGSNAASQMSQVVSDSLDAFISARTSHPSVSRPSAEALRTSILDAEETCHAFPLRKSSTPVDVQTASGNGYSAGCSQDLPSNLLKLADAGKVTDQDGRSQNPPTEKTQIGLLVSSRSHLYDDERSLGLTGIKWNDSLGPFDLGMATAKLTGGDSTSIGGFVK